MPGGVGSSGFVGKFRQQYLYLRPLPHGQGSLRFVMSEYTGRTCLLRGINAPHQPEWQSQSLRIHGCKTPNENGAKHRMKCRFALITSQDRSIATITTDIAGEEGPKDPDTVRSYLDTLERIMIVEDQPAFAPKLRSRSRLRRAPRRHFVDPSLAVAALGATAERLIGDLEHLGTLFESLVVRDLRIHAQANEAKVYHYRDSTDLEVDAVMETPDGKWAAFEIKLGDRRIDEAAKSLLTFRNRIDSPHSGFLGVIVSAGYSYVRPDGVAVIAARALGP